MNAKQDKTMGKNASEVHETEVTPQAQSDGTSSTSSTSNSTAVLAPGNPNWEPTAFDPSFLIEGEETGYEELTREDYQVPLLTILQSNSPQVKRSSDRYLEGASEGDIFSSTTGTVFDGAAGVLVIPCATERKHVEWVPRDSGGSGGFVGQHDVEKNILAQCTRDGSRTYLPNGNEIIDTVYNYVLLLDENNKDSFEPIVIPMSRTQLKIHRRWTEAQTRQAVTIGGKRYKLKRFHQIWRLSTIGESRNGYDYMNWNVSFVGPVQIKEIADAAKDFRDTILSGQFKPQIKHEYDDNGFDVFGGGNGDSDGEGSDRSNGRSGTSSPSDDDDPFDI